MRTSQLEGPALDYMVALVAQAEGIKNFTDDHRVVPSGERWMPSTNWEQGGPIIERYRMTLRPGRDEIVATISDQDGRSIASFGPTYLVAAMRVLVIWKFGENVAVHPNP